MPTHRLKTHPKFFKAVFEGRKTFEYRLNDRNYQVGDRVDLCEYDPETRVYSGREIVAKVTYILHSGELGLPKDHVILAIKVILISDRTVG